MQLTDIRDAAKRRAGMDTNDGMVADTVMTEFVNGAVRQVALMMDWDWNFASETIASVADQAAYTRAADCKRTDRVVDAEDNALLEQISKRQAVRFNPGSTQTRSLPRFWYVEGGSLYLVPTPTSARNYTHVYVATEPTLSLDADEPDIPDYAIDLVVIKAAIMVSARTDNTSLQMLLQQEEKDLLDSFYDEARRSRGSVVPQTRRDWHVG